MGSSFLMHYFSLKENENVISFLRWFFLLSKYGSTKMQLKLCWPQEVVMQETQKFQPTEYNTEE